VSNSRPGQLETSEFEQVILDRIAAENPAIAPFCRRLRVLSREFTGCGSFTNFQVEDVPEAGRAPKRVLDLSGIIRMPGVPSGMAALLFCRGDRPECLELYCYGAEHWEGDPAGFSIEE
jgi:hypothetical protein